MHAERILLLYAMLEGVAILRIFTMVTKKSRDV